MDSMRADVLLLVLGFVAVPLESWPWAIRPYSGIFDSGLDGFRACKIRKMQNAYRYGAKVSEARDEHPYELQHVLLAEGDQGDEQWEPQFSSIEEVREILCRLDDIGAGQVDWNDIVGNCNYFKGLSRLRFPPLYGLDGFADLSDDFLHVLDPPEDDDTPNQSFNRSRLYLRKDKASVVESEFRVFLEHLKSLPLIKGLL